MNALEGIRSAFDTLRASRLRAFFIIQCTAIGVTFLIAMITIIEGMSKYVETDFVGKIYGFHTVQLRQMPSDKPPSSVEEARAWERRPRLSFDDAEWLKSRIEVPGTIAYSASGTARVGTWGGKAFERVRVIGASHAHFAVQNLLVEEGRPFSEREASHGTAVAVLGWDLARKMYGSRSPLGRRITINGHHFRVIGTLERRGSVLGFSLDRIAIVPARSAVNGTIYPMNEAEVIAFKVRDPAAMPAATAEIDGWMRVHHRLRPTEDSDFTVGSSAAIIAAWERISRTLLIAAPCLIGIALIVGIVVTMNIMLVIVTERTAEIGLRKAVGARHRDILWQFLVEAGSLSGLGGAAGVALGILLAAGVAAASPLPVRVAPWSVVLGIAMGVGVGLAAGVYPAYRAARLDPVVAMGRE